MLTGQRLGDQPPAQDPGSPEDTLIDSHQAQSFRSMRTATGCRPRFGRSHGCVLGSCADRVILAHIERRGRPAVSVAGQGSCQGAGGDWIDGSKTDADQSGAVGVASHAGIGDDGDVDQLAGGFAGVDDPRRCGRLDMVAIEGCEDLCQIGAAQSIPYRWLAFDPTISGRSRYDDCAGSSL